ncbi:hypothetical protein [Methanobacterium sp. SMA-27]|nr:hypothetical protein [Methanobacterium sp. SMA-27]
MYKYPTKRELLEARKTKPFGERLVMAVEHLCDILENRDRKQLNDSW